MDVLEGKSIFLWNVPSVANGDPQQIATLLHNAGFQTVIVKGGSGNAVYVPPIFPFAKWNKKPNITPELIQALHNVGIKVAGFGFCYGIDPVGEGSVAAKLLTNLDLDAWVWDVEDSFESFLNNNSDTGFQHAQLLIQSYLTNKTRSVPTAFCSWARWHDPNPKLNRPWHNEKMGGLFMAFCDYGMPMCYWSRLGPDNKPIKPLPVDATNLLTEAIKQWAPITDKTLIPVGRAFTGTGGIATGPAAAAFDTLARANHMRGVSWWGLDWAKSLPDVWGVLNGLPSAYEAAVPTIPSTSDPSQAANELPGGSG